MEYNKRRWLERIQQQQQEEEEKPRDVYAIEHGTYFSKKYEYYYIAMVEVYEEHTEIELYRKTTKKKIQAPSWVKLLLKVLEDEPEDNKKPIAPTQIISHNDIVPRVIRKMVVDYEIPLYQRFMAEEEKKEIYIDYAEELRERLKRRPVITNLNNEMEKHTTFQQDYEINDFFSIDAPEQTEEEIFYDQLKEKARTSGMSEESLKQLKQNKDKILKFEARRSG